MDPDQALEIVRRLTDGLDPKTGEELPADGPYQRPQVIRALFVAQRALEAETSRSDRRRKMPENTGRPWSGEEDGRLVAGFEAEKPIRTLAAEHKRTPGAIRSRLVLLGKLEPAGDGRR